MNTECPSCKEAREETEYAAEGWLHPSRDYPELLHCNCCGYYYHLQQNHLVWVPRASLSAYRPAHQLNEQP